MWIDFPHILRSKTESALLVRPWMVDQRSHVWFVLPERELLTSKCQENHHHTPAAGGRSTCVGNYQWTPTEDECLTVSTEKPRWTVRIQNLFWSFLFFFNCTGATSTLTCSFGGSRGNIWGPCPVLTHTRAVIKRRCPWFLMKRWAEERCWCRMRWRSWAELRQLPTPPPFCLALRLPSRPSKTRTFPVNIVTRNPGRTIQLWSSGWWWRPGRAQSWRTAWGAPRSCWRGSSATGACWRQTSPNLQWTVTRWGCRHCRHSRVNQWYVVVQYDPILTVYGHCYTL